MESLLKSQFLLNPDITYLNFGSFGACAKPVFENYQQWQRELESEPVQFIAFNGPRYLKQSREALAEYIRCAADDLVYVTNPSYGVNIIAKSLRLEPGDEILSTDLEYGACDKTWNYYCRKSGARYVRQHITLPITSREQLVEEFFKGLTNRTKAIFISHITSATGLILPVTEICAIAKEKGLLTFVDGAHVPGHIPLDLSVLQADIYTGACHKWMLTPKSCSFLYVKKQLQHLFDPLLISWGYDSATPSGSQFIDYHQGQGTRDFSAFLTVPAAITFMKEHDWTGVAANCRKMVQENAGRFCELMNTSPLSPVTDEFIGQMCSIPVETEQPEALQLELFEKYKIEIPVMKQDGRIYIRYSINAFNSQDDLDKLYNALKKIMAVLIFFLFNLNLHAQPGQQNLSRVSQMADLPKPLKIIDFRQLARDFDSTVFDFNAKGKYWPMVWMDSSGRNFPQPVVGLYTALADVRQGRENNKGMFHEALANMGAVLGASLAGIDKNKHLNYVGMLKNYFNRETGWNIMMNNTCPEVALLGGGYGRDWWYDVYPNVLFYAINDLYPDEPGFDSIAHAIAEKFYSADSVLNGNYNYSFFDYGSMKPMKNTICAQPDAAAGHAYVLYAAYKKFGDARYLKGALSALSALQSNKINPTYEVLMPYGALLAARINAELGKDYDVMKLLDWSFDGTAVCREGWGILTGRWNGMDISGIVGSTVDHGGYGFLMNTYDAAIPLIPLVRYDQSYAHAVGKWMLNAANAAKLFYPQYMPRDHQTLFEQSAVTKGVIGYEGIIKQSSYKEHESLKAPVAQGDGPLWVPGKNPDVTQFSVYGSAHVGIFGSIIKSTNIPGILCLDLLATDFYHDKAWPSYLYFNPYDADKSVGIVSSSGKAVDLYNTVTHTFVSKGIRSGKIKVPAKQAWVIVCVPAGGKQSIEGEKMMVDGVVVDYHYLHQ